MNSRDSTPLVEYAYTPPQAGLPDAVPGQRIAFESDGIALQMYQALPPGPPYTGVRPLLLVHSINAAASTYDVRPLFEYYRQSQPVFALDLSGFGISERGDCVYDPRMMTNAIHAAIQKIKLLLDHECVDLLAVSLSCEFAARAAVEQPDTIRSLAFISPTGFEARARRPSRRSTNSSTLAKPWLYALVNNRLWGEGLFRLLTSKPSVRFFLQKTWGSKQIDEGLLRYCLATARQPGARFAPFRFVEGRLFSSDVLALYERLTQPVWMSHGIRGDFVDYSRKDAFLQRPNWHCTVFPTGAFPHFEAAIAFREAFDQFQRNVIRMQSE
jgi:pimeloyl-ACP methyl ester carboxylesterase